ncbi:hypothetical protein ACOMICROBIO_NCLOACGD_00167 [Vibrio sp. B1ASS3]|nr:hypothetical protein ACOMICROBIO_NCLOACGD_00167 [Vibrio sp. B1ASS3]CAE6879594.1 hypothetical protein ACOMICROBIO_NCLOACGD_00167 [Vibrio sp. B1ASS3]
MKILGFFVTCNQGLASHYREQTVSTLLYLGKIKERNCPRPPNPF